MDFESMITYSLDLGVLPPLYDEVRWNLAEPQGKLFMKFQAWTRVTFSVLKSLIATMMSPGRTWPVFSAAPPT